MVFWYNERDSEVPQLVAGHGDEDVTDNVSVHAIHVSAYAKIIILNIYI